MYIHIETTRHYEIDNPDTHAEWDRLAPESGIIHLGIDRRAFSISMFHQLRCLDVVRETLADARQDRQTSFHEVSTTSHCLNYLRQMALCRSDTALSAILGVQNHQYPSVYQCRDWNAVYREAISNQIEYARWEAAQE